MINPYYVIIETYITCIVDACLQKNIHLKYILNLKKLKFKQVFFQTFSDENIKIT